MPYYSSPDQFYSCIGETISRARQHSPQAVAAMQKSRLIVRMHFSGPAAELLVNGRKNPMQVSFGTTKLRSDLEMQLASDTFHRILLDEITIKSALARGQIKVRGPVWKLKPLGEIIRAGKQHYPLVLKQFGLDGKRG